MRRRALLMLLAASLATAVVVGLVLLKRNSPAPAALDTRPPPGLAARFRAPDGWTWGLLQPPGGPAQRYGVAAPTGPTRCDVVVLPGYSEFAEKWFETARDLIAEGCAVWVLDRTGQGGSARWSAPADVGHARSLEPDVAASRLLVDEVVRRPGRPVILLGHSLGCAVALAAVADGLRVDGLVLSSPALALRVDPSQRSAAIRAAGWLRPLSLDRLRAPAQGGWRRDGPDGVAARATHDPTRGRVQLGWQTANPDLRMGGVSLGWLRAYQRLTNRLSPDRLEQVRTPVLMLTAGDDAYVDPAAAAAACRRLPACILRADLKARHELALEADAHRRPWLASVRAFIAARRQAEPLPTPEPAA